MAVDISPVMSMILSHPYPTFPLAVLLAAAVAFYLFLKFGRKEHHHHLSLKPTRKAQDPSAGDPKKPIQRYRELFFKLQNLEDYPEVLEPARDELLFMFSWAVSLALQQPDNSILAIERYDNAKTVWDFVKTEHDEVLTQWGSYLERRKRGRGGPELFATPEAAKAWLVRHAPVKLVDGAWLAHMHRITTPFALRGVTKHAWQVLSEELGDGELAKHHVYLYHRLLESVGCPLPSAHSIDFVRSHHWKDHEDDDNSCWESAVGQLLISLFPHEFLPEILGFNMHYELVTLDTLRAAHELRALGIDPYYFLLHVSIDNADSGHTAMAAHTVTQYLGIIGKAEGEEGVQRAWKRVQAGYTLSQALGGSFSSFASSSFPREMSLLLQPKLDLLGKRVVGILKAKASISHQLHCQSRARIGGRTLAEWLAPSAWTGRQSEIDLLTALSRAKPWIQPGEITKSLLVRELSWGGRMFGAFTRDEVVTLTAWIDSLGSADNPTNNDGQYWGFTGRNPLASKDAVGLLRDYARHYPVATTVSESPEAVESSWPQLQTLYEHLPLDGQTLEHNQKQPLGPLILPSSFEGPLLSNLIALWFAHIGLLEGAVAAPSRTATPVYAAILRVLRAQAGFAAEAPVVAGMDEMKPSIGCDGASASLSVVDIGLEMVTRAKWTVCSTSAPPSCLHDVLVLAASHGQGGESTRLTRDMLRWAARPVANLGLLLGLALAFLELKDAVAKTPGLLSPQSRDALETIAVRERRGLEECVGELRAAADTTQYRQLLQGYRLGRAVLEGCL